MLLRHPRRLRLHGKPGVLLLKRGLLPEASRLGGERAGLLLSGALLLLARVGTKGAPILLLTWVLGITAWVGVRVRVRIHGASSASLAERAGRGGVVTDVTRSTRGVGEDEDEAVSALRQERRAETLAATAMNGYATGDITKMNAKKWTLRRQRNDRKLGRARG